MNHARAKIFFTVKARADDAQLSAKARRDLQEIIEFERLD
jgi:hypothetical protein